MNIIINKIILMFAIIFGTVLKSFLLEFYCLEKLQVLFNERKKKTFAGSKTVLVVNFELIKQFSSERRFSFEVGRPFQPRQVVFLRWLENALDSFH